MELAYKEDLFMLLSMSMDMEEATKHTERIANNFKKAYSPKPSTLKPIVGSDTYRYYLREMKQKGWDMWYESRVDKYVNGKWEVYMKFIDECSKCDELVKRLEMGGNTLIKF